MLKVIIILIVVAILIWLLVSNIRIVPQAKAYVVERLGAYHSTWQVGLHFKLPLVDKISRKVSLKEKVIDFPPQPVITKDNV
ncbi:MAG: peptidase, partial [Firmicutes bacterium]|nr:peptidase [Bacillota bacterium]